MTDENRAKAKADFQAAHDELVALHMRMVNDNDMAPIDFYNLIVNYAAWAGTALIPLGQERQAVKVMGKSFVHQIEAWLADPNVKASRAAVLTDTGMH